MLALAAERMELARVKKRFLGYLRSVIDYYPAVRFEPRSAALLLKPSRTHIPTRFYR